MPGCIAFRVFTDRHSDTGITVVHEWIDKESFDRYLTSAAFIRSGEILRPLMTEPPSSRRFLVESAETVA